MWPILLRVLRQYAPAITLPFAALVGIIGYNIENLVSDKYTPYSEAIKDRRTERLVEEAASTKKGETLKYKTDVLDTNLSPSLQN